MSFADWEHSTNNCVELKWVSLYLPSLPAFTWNTFRGTSPRPWLSHTYPRWKIYMDDIISIVKKEQVDTLFNHLNSVDTHIKIMIEDIVNDGSIQLLDTKCFLSSDHTIKLCVYLNVVHTSHFQDQNSNNQIPVKTQSSNS